MKKILLAAAVAVAASGLWSCKSDKAGQNDSAAQEAVEASETLTQETATDTAKYNQTFFANVENEASAPSPEKWQVTESGLKYTVVTEGTGKQPTATDNVTVHYTGRLTNGTVFDSSVDRGVPATFPLNRVIPGWTEGLQLMKEGGKTVFYIPSNLAYGAAGAPGAIPPNSDLIFEVELLEVN